MKPLHLFLPVMAAAAIGLALPALAQQSGDGAAKTPSPTAATQKTIEVTTSSSQRAEAMPSIKVNGVAEKSLQAVLNEALSFKGTDAEFAKKAALWKKEHGYTVVRKGPGHIVISSDTKGNSLKVEVMKGEGASLSTSIARTDRALKAGSPAEVRELRIIGPSEKAADGAVRIELRGDDIAKIHSDNLLKVKPIEGTRIYKDLGETDVKILKDLPSIEGFKVLRDGDTRILRLDSSALREGKPLTEKERAAIKKEIQALRLKLRSLSKEGGDTIEIRPGKMLSEKDLKDLKELKSMKGFGEMKDLHEGILKEFKLALPELNGKLLAPLEGGTFVFGHGMIEGLSEADQKKMHEEIAKVHAETEKKIAEITAKYKAKAKKPAK